MSWQEKRIVTILFAVLLTLAAVLLVVLGIRYRENRAKEEAEELPTDLVSGPVTEENPYTALSYDNGATLLSFSRNEEGLWHWDGNPDFPLEETVITEILALVSNWTPQQTLTDAGSLENSGLDEPIAFLTATTSNGNITTLHFGKTFEEGGHYVRFNGDETTVYVIGNELFQLMEVPIYDMCVLPELPSIPEARIRSIVVRGSAQEEETTGITTILTAQQAEEGDAVTWRTSGGNVTDDPAVRGLLEDLAALDIEKCVDFNPSDEAAEICGFSEPAAELWVDYTTEGGADQSLRLTIGNRLPDGSGRYVRLGEDTTIYLLLTDLLDPLMTLAAEGLE